MKNDIIIRAIASGDAEKLTNAIKQKQGKVYVIRTFLYALKVSSWRKMPFDLEEIVLDENSSWGKYFLKIIANEKDLKGLSGCTHLIFHY
jgi:hypothetical protein